MRISLLCLFTLALSTSTLTASRLDSLLRVLDATIKERPYYAEMKEQRIDTIKARLNNTTDLGQRYLICGSLFLEYCTYNMDSALDVSNKRLVLAEAMHNTAEILTSRMNIAEIFGGMGMYRESLDILDQIDQKDLGLKERTYYFHILHSNYRKLADNSLLPEETLRYEQLVRRYKDSLLLVNEPTSPGYLFIKSGKLEDQGRCDEALTLMSQCYRENGAKEDVLGILAYELSVIYKCKGDLEQEKSYLAISAIADLRKAVKEYIALRKLASLLYQQGDVDRAYSYIKCSMEDATFCKARFRTLEIAEMLPIISEAYDQKADQERGRLIRYLSLITLMSIILLASIAFICRQMKRLSSARKSINMLYEDVKRMNEDLNKLNKKLLESNRVKETYIGSIFNLCSTYIDKMETYRISVNRKLKAGLQDEASKMTSSPLLVADELKEFFRNFDATFMSIYPNFIGEFNALLLPDERIAPKSGDILTPELRIFALVRLGIGDSSKIASFLHYSPQTVYNYKLKVRNKLAVSKEEFSTALQQIGV